MELLIKNIMLNSIAIEKLYKIMKKNETALVFDIVLICGGLCYIAKKVSIQQEQINELKNDIEILHEGKEESKLKGE